MPQNDITETTRLVIRRFTPQDGPALYRYLSDERVVRYEPYPPQTAEQCEEAARQRAVSKNFWAVCLREDGQLIGNVYLAPQEQGNWEVG